MAPVSEQRLVFGTGPLPCKVLVLGEAPGVQEEAELLPFVGPSGRVLGKLMTYAGLSREGIRLENVLLWRPPGNRRPTKREIRESTVLERIAAVQPRYIVACGATALTALGVEGKVSRLHGRAVQWNGIIVVPMYHPAVLLHDGGAELVAQIKRDWEGLKEILNGRVERTAMGERGRNYRLATEAEAVLYLKGVQLFSFDLETTEPDVAGTFVPREARILGYSVSTGSGNACFVSGPPRDLRPLLESETVTKVCHNSKFEYEVLCHGHNTHLARFDDTKLMAYVLGYRDTGLKSLAREVLHEEMLTLDDVKRGRPTEEILPEEWLPYAAADADMTLRLYMKFKEELG